MSKHEFPSLDRVYDEVERIAHTHDRLVRSECLGLSDQGREVRAVHVTDSDASDDDKQTAVIVCGRHGNELGTRAVGPAMLRWLVSDEAATTRQHQHVVVVPVANPDGCTGEEFGAPPWHLSSMERRTIGRLADELGPDAIIDVHSFGADDADLQAVVTGNNTEEGEDRFLYGAVAHRLVEAAAENGYPFLIHTEKRNEGYNNFIAGLCYDWFHTLAIGMEVNHHVLSPDEAGAAGLSVIRTLLDEGNGRSPWQAWDGYPTDLLRGDFAASIRPLGADAAARRKSRAAIWQNRRFFHLGRREAPSRNTVRIAAHYSGDATDSVSHGFTLCCRVRGVRGRVKAELNGQAVEAATYYDRCSTYVFVAVQPSGPQQYELIVSR
ncbi:MAG: hypothetical protein JXL80_04185 [Planctomycetes bacterium]|nr:hypothetical protein [Planctomycetota bacterium]